MTGASLPGDQLFDAPGQSRPACVWTDVSKTCPVALILPCIQVSVALLSLLTNTVLLCMFATCSPALFIVLVGLGANLDQRASFFFENDKSVTSFLKLAN